MQIYAVYAKSDFVHLCMKKKSRSALKNKFATKSLKLVSSI